MGPGRVKRVPVSESRLLLQDVDPEPVGGDAVALLQLLTISLALHIRELGLLQHSTMPTSPHPLVENFGSECF